MSSSVRKGKQRAVDEETASSAVSLSTGEGESFAPARAETSWNGKQRAASADATDREPASWIPAKSWVHFVAGGVGGMCGGIVTAPFDVAKTRYQSDLFQKNVGTSTIQQQPGAIAGTRRLLYHFVETGVLLRDIGRNEGLSALFRGLGPTLVGVIPARSINFFAYGNGKKIYARALNDGKESAPIHLIAAATAGVLTATATNPIWVVKTRLQLQDSAKQSKPSSSSSATSSRIPRSAAFSSIAASKGTSHSLFTPSFARAAATVTAAPPPHFSNSFQCIAHIWRHEGVPGFYRGLSASYLGVAEGTIQWTLYEQFKAMRRRRGMQKEEGWADKVGAAGLAKLIATVITYPHEVVRTRLRQAPPPGWARPKYHGLLQTFNLVLKEEGVKALYGGLSPHLLRVVPNAAVMYSIYELVLKYAEIE